MNSATDWRPSGGISVEPNASLAILEQERSVVVTAGPGAGKTELLAQRADYLLRTGLCRYPSRILAISFKVDSARNIRERVRERCGELLANRFDSVTFHAFAKRIVDNYRVLLTGANQLDADYKVDPKYRIPRKQITYDDLIEFAVEILEASAAARNSLRQTYKYVFLDEFQDATGSQYKLLKEAFQGSGAILTAVGDTKQRIMQFAGALEGIFESFADDFGAHPLPLYQNFRSAPVIRRMHNRMVKALDPEAAVSASELAGEEGHIQVLSFADDKQESKAVVDLIENWLETGVPPSEIAILVRQQPHLICESLGKELSVRNIAYRNEQAHQDLSAEPAAALVFDLIRVLVDKRHPKAYEELMRLVYRSGITEETSSRYMSQIGRFLAVNRLSPVESAKLTPSAWNDLVFSFLRLVTRPVITALSPAYQHGNSLDEVVKGALGAFHEALREDSNPTRALDRLSEVDAIKLFTIHKCKGMEFSKVVVLGVESQCFWGDIDTSRAEFFVAISRAKKDLYLTTADFRGRPDGATSRWDELRSKQEEFLAYATE